MLQNGLLAIWRKAAMFDPHGAQACAWISQIARVVHKEDQPVPDELEEDPGTEPSPSQSVATKQEAGHRAIAAAPR
ncbi:hypothetical protein [Cribrihabitans neustonicus]|uniref:hypothetical protein n=1 Tax=Cribrihabitans neustonicus TaxID=1429085 RepID=UPI003B5A8595